MATHAALGTTLVVALDATHITLTLGEHTATSLLADVVAMTPATDDWIPALIATAPTVTPGATHYNDITVGWVKTIDTVDYPVVFTLGWASREPELVALRARVATLEPIVSDMSLLEIQCGIGAVVWEGSEISLSKLILMFMNNPGLLSDTSNQNILISKLGDINRSLSIVFPFGTLTGTLLQIFFQQNNLRDAVGLGGAMNPYSSTWDIQAIVAQFCVTSGADVASARSYYTAMAATWHAQIDANYVSLIADPDTYPTATDDCAATHAALDTALSPIATLMA